MRAFSSGIRPHRHRIEVDADDGVDRVDQRYGIGAAFFGGASWVADIGDVRRQFHDDWQTRIVFAPARDHFDVFGNLSDGGAHSAFAHAVRAAKVQFDSIGAGVFNARQDAFPRFFDTRNHQGDHHRAIWPVTFDAGDFLQIGCQVAVRDQLDVVEAEHSLIRPDKRCVAWAVDVDHARVFAKGFPDDAPPSCLKGTDDVAFPVGGWR